jgi:hypothetical protein
MTLDPIQADVARIALAAAGHDFALAGGNALIAHGLLSRPTADVDLFSPLAAGAAHVADQVRGALTDAGYHVELVAGLSNGQVDFARFHVTRDDTTVLLDLARDWRGDPPAQLSIGPVLSLDDAVASKVAAMLGRALPRDYIDVGATLQTYTREQLITLALARDPGLRPEDVTAAMQQLDRLPDEEFVAYGLSVSQVEALRRAFDAWPRAVAPDELARPRHTGPRDGTERPQIVERTQNRPRPSTYDRPGPPEDRGHDRGR